MPMDSSFVENHPGLFENCKAVVRNTTIARHVNHLEICTRALLHYRDLVFQVDRVLSLKLKIQLSQ